MAWIETYGHGGDLLTAEKLFDTPAGDFLDFSANINPLGPPAFVMKRLQDQLKTIIHYPDPAQRLLKQKLAEKLSVLPENILIGNGAAECMALAILGLQPETVGIVYPCFSEYEQLTRSYGAKVKSIYGKREYNYKPDMSSIQMLLAETDLVFLGHPNNPTGILYTKEELMQIASFAQQTHTYVIMDEAFIDFIPVDKQVTLLTKMKAFQHIVFIRSMTKFYAIPGLRLGYAISQPDIIAKLQKKQVTWSVNQLALAAGEACLEEQEYEQQTITLIEEQRSYVTRFITERLGWFVFPGQANFLLIRLPNELEAADLQWKLGKKGILIRSCSMYPGLTSHDVRIAIRTKHENDRLLQALQEVEKEEIR
ncbi:threonine-phosphate decarboxylase CobD [Ectobacillus sp. sgz5001026]|uniref:threonine-phosphate decarboxylase CobD n=1 Tax=Ectobacillus sp. sgz5001026 TaxID=3242473 RepID=UPI0036D43508